jgi:hypothetical protein
MQWFLEKDTTTSLAHLLVYVLIYIHAGHIVLEDMFANLIKPKWFHMPGIYIR